MERLLASKQRKVQNRMYLDEGQTTGGALGKGITKDYPHSLAVYTGNLEGTSSDGLEIIHDHLQHI